MQNRDLKYWVALKWVEGVGNVGYKALLTAFGTPQKVFASPLSMIKAVPGIGEQTAHQIKHFSDWEKVEKELDCAKRTGVSIVTSQDSLYPPHLACIYDPPAYLYVKGCMKEDDVNVAFVGSRAASTHGLFTTERLCRELALQGVTIVSGMARGIDSAAHRGALTGRGRTIAVLGCGLDIVYPPENEKLLSQIVANGAVISEFPFGTRPNAPNFPARNRIISGISLGVVVVEAGEKSGSLITARIALEQGREVFAVPGSIDASGSRGTNKLIKQGAKLIENIDDILEEILPQARRIPVSVKAEPSGDNAVNRREKREPAPDKALTENEKAIWQSLSQKPVHIDEIIASTGRMAPEVLSGLLNLELKGVIEQKPGKMYVRKEL
ncbi:MAG: DNA-processing protein DprA [Deltaproteobacteria bacterium]|nr:DNA-processing protein DprA [Deltaproteobacteria bacterium]